MKRHTRHSRILNVDCLRRTELVESGMVSRRFQHISGWRSFGALWAGSIAPIREHRVNKEAAFHILTSQARAAIQRGDVS